MLERTFYIYKVLSHISKWIFIIPLWDGEVILSYTNDCIYSFPHVYIIHIHPIGYVFSEEPKIIEILVPRGILEEQGFDECSDLVLRFLDWFTNLIRLKVVNDSISIGKENIDSPCYDLAIEIHKIFPLDTLIITYL